MASRLKLYALAIPNFFVAPPFSMKVPFHIVYFFALAQALSTAWNSFPLPPYHRFYFICVSLIHHITVIFCAASSRKPSLILLQVGEFFCPPGKTPLSSQSSWAYLTLSSHQICWKLPFLHLLLTLLGSSGFLRSGMVSHYLGIHTAWHNSWHEVVT